MTTGFNPLIFFLSLLKREFLYSEPSDQIRRLPGCKFSSDGYLKKKERGVFAEKQCCFDEFSIPTVKWYDNIDVVLASTFAKVHPVNIIQRWDRAKKGRIKIDYPDIVKEYNTFMGVLTFLMHIQIITEQKFDQKSTN